MNTELILRNLPALFCAIFTGVLFIQSGLDKILDWNGNLGFLRSHFSKSFLSGMVPMMLATVTLMELVTGFLAAAGAISIVASGSLKLTFYASIVGAASITALFFGQRIAKDYAGAAVLV